MTTPQAAIHTTNQRHKKYSKFFYGFFVAFRVLKPLPKPIQNALLFQSH